MTSSASTARKTGLTQEQLVAMHPYVVDIPDGKLAEGAPTLPTSVDDFKTVEADVDALFETHLPDFLAGARRAGAAGDVGARWPRRQGGRAARRPPADRVVAGQRRLPGALRLGDRPRRLPLGRGQGQPPRTGPWPRGGGEGQGDRGGGPEHPRGQGHLGRDEDDGGLASQKDEGGAWYFAQRLGEFVKANPGAITVHAAGHSAGFDLPLPPGPRDPRGRRTRRCLARPAGAGHPGRGVQEPGDEEVRPGQDRTARHVHDVGVVREEGHLHRHLRQVPALPDPCLAGEGAQVRDPRSAGVHPARRRSLQALQGTGLRRRRER